jgi:hypothetical protein
MASRLAVGSSRVRCHGDARRALISEKNDDATARRRTFDAREFRAAVPGAAAALRALLEQLELGGGPEAVVGPAKTATYAVERLYDAARRIAEPVL